MALPVRDSRRNSMKTATRFLPTVLLCLTLAVSPGCLIRNPGPAPAHRVEAPPQGVPSAGGAPGVAGPAGSGTVAAAPGNAGDSKAAVSAAPVPRPLDQFLEKAVSWLVKAQHPDGGWGGGSHANQAQRDPHAVVTDPATSAFTAMAL